MPLLTSDEYKDQGGKACPGCGSQRFDTGSLEHCGNYVWQGVLCLECNHYWEDIYTLTGYRNLQKED